MSRIPEEHPGQAPFSPSPGPPNTLPPEIVSFPLGNTDSYHSTDSPKVNVTQTATYDGINIVPARSSARAEPRSNNNRGRCPTDNGCTYYSLLAPIGGAKYYSVLTSGRKLESFFRCALCIYYYCCFFAFSS